MSNRASADRHLASDAARWRQEARKSFEQWHDYFRRDLTSVVEFCVERQIFGVYQMLGHSMAQRLVEDGLSEAGAREKVREFLQSEPARAVPYCDISALLYATMAMKVADGQRTVPDHSHYNDIQFIAAFLPYCDAICVDEYFGEVLRRKSAARHLAAYPAKVFSFRQRERFLEYLTQLEAGMNPDLNDTVLAVYGSGWLKPYETILEHERERETRT